MKLKELLDAYGDYKCRVSHLNGRTHYIDNKCDLRWVKDTFGDCKVSRFYAYAYDDFDGFISVTIKED